MLHPKHHKTALLIIGGFSALAGLVAILSYMSKKKHEKIEGDILVLDREIKSLDYALKAHDAEKKGLI